MMFIIIILYMLSAEKMPSGVLRNLLAHTTCNKFKTLNVQHNLNMYCKFTIENLEVSVTLDLNKVERKNILA